LASARRIVNTQGIRGLYKGTLISVLGVVDGALQLATYDQMKYRLTDEHGTFPAWAQLLAGAGSRGIALVATYPYQLLRSVLQQQNCPYNGVVHAAQHIVRTEGMRGLYKGIGLNLTRSIPPAACMFLLLEQFRLAIGSSSRNGV
jgi:solute carrier family 25 folate transporter 32